MFTKPASFNVSVFGFLYAPMTAVILAVVLLITTGCMTVTVTYNLEGSSQINNSPISQDKPIQASPYLNTTGKDIGQAANAFFGGIQIDDLMKRLDEITTRLRSVQSSN